MSKNRFEEKKELAAQAVELKKESRLEEAVQLLEDGLEKYPGDRFLRASLADAYLRQNKFSAARRIANELMEENPSDHRALLIRGQINYRRRQYEKALEHYREAYRAKEKAFIAFKLINTLEKLGKIEEGLELCREWLERKPEDSRFLRQKAQLKQKSQQEDEAGDLYEQYLEQEPEDDFALKEKIKLKLRDKKAELAVRELKNLMRLDKYNKNPHLHDLMAEKLEKMGAYEQALAEYKKSRELNPEGDFSVKKIGYLLKDMEEYEQAREYLEMAFTADPADFYVRSSLLAVYKELGAYQEGIEFFKGIIRDNSDFKNLWGIIKKLSREAEKEADDGKQN